MKNAEDYFRIKLTDTLHVTDIISIHYFAFTKDYDFLGESHDFYEIVYVDSGEMIVTDEGREFLLRQNEMFLHFPNHFHKLKCNNQVSNVTIFSFSLVGSIDLLMDRIMAFDKADRDLSRNLLNEAVLSYIDPLNVLEQKKMNKREKVPYGSDQMIRISIEMLLLNLMRKQLNIQSPKIPECFGTDDYQEAITNKIIRILKDSLGGTLTISKIASRVGYSPAYVKQVFKRVTHSSIINYYINLKINKAKELIGNTNLPFKDISEQLGFSSLQFFSRQFKKFTNMTPSSYRKSSKLLSIL